MFRNGLRRCTGRKGTGRKHHSCSCKDLEKKLLVEVKRKTDQIIKCIKFKGGVILGGLEVSKSNDRANA
jgi:hypothetical protein